MTESLTSARGTIKFTQTFKTRTDGAGVKTKREAVVVEFPRPDVEAIKSEVLDKIVEVALISYAKSQFIENGDDNSWVPDAESITVESYYADLVAPSKRGQRFLTATKLKEYGYHFARLTKEYLPGKSEGATGLAVELIQGKFTQVIGKQEILEKMAEWIVELHDKMPEAQQVVSDKLSELLAETLENFAKAPVDYSALLDD